MKVARALLAFLWLALAVSATAHAGPASTCHMAGMKTHPAAPADQSTMPCCSQPVVIEAPAPVVLSVRRIENVRLFPAPMLVLTSHIIAAEPHPPKSLLNA